MTTPNTHTPDPVAGRPRDDPLLGLPPRLHPDRPAGTYCSTACRKTAFRRRHQQPGPAVTVPAARPRREYTVYECPDCGERQLGEQRCETCRTFTRRVGVGGPCPNCDEPVAVTDLLAHAVITTTKP